MAHWGVDPGSDRREAQRYSVLFDGEEVGWAGSVAGMMSALSPDSESPARTVSIAYVERGREWFEAWASSRDSRTIEIRDLRRRLQFRLRCVRIYDASQCGVVFEAQVESAHEIEFGSFGVLPKKPQ